MKKLLRSVFTLALATTISYSTQAQLDGNSQICPDFTATDILGTSHTLYDYLDAGKIVYVDVSATWCGPCWSLHQTGILEDLYETSGPDGTNEIMVLWVEGDQSTNSADLNGTGSSTQGDWVTGVTYPIIDDNGTINTALEIAYFPTVYRIYPDRSVEVISASGKTVQQIRDEEQTVSLGTNSLDAKIFFKPFIDKIDCDGFLQPRLTMQNFGTTAITSATIELIANGTVEETINWTGNIVQYSVDEITFGLTDLADGNYTLEMKISNVNGGTDEDLTNNVGTEHVVIDRNGLTPSLTINADEYGNEVSWEILNWNNSVVIQGSDYSQGTAAGDFITISKNLCLADNQCYTFVIKDSYGDGLSGNSNAGGSISLNGSDLMSFTATEHAGSEFSKEFCLGTPTGINENEATSFEVYPNPFNQQATVKFNVTSINNVKVNLTNVLGEVVYSENLGNLNEGNYSQTINSNDLVKGIYFLNLSIGANTTTQKVTVN
jgi:hypothetical protein